MYRKCLSAIAIMMLLAPMTVAVASVGQAGGLGLGAPDWVPGPKPQTTESDDEASTVGSAGEAIQAAVGMPQRIRDRLMNQVGGAGGQGGRLEGDETPFAFGLAIAGKAGQQDGEEPGDEPDPASDPDNAADTETGSPPDSPPGLGNGAAHMSGFAKEALGTVAEKLTAMAGVEQAQQTDHSARNTALTRVAARLGLLAGLNGDGQ